MTRPALLRVCDRNNGGEEELMFLAQARTCAVCSYQDLSHVNVERNNSQRERVWYLHNISATTGGLSFNNFDGPIINVDSENDCVTFNTRDRTEQTRS